MSWDVFLVHSSVTLPIQDADQITPRLGSQGEIISTFQRLLPTLQFPDGKWAYLDNDDFSIEFNLGSDEPIPYVALHIRGSDTVVDTLRHICEQTGWQAFDTTTGNFLNFAQNPATGLRAWRAGRDQVMNYLQAQGEKLAKDSQVLVSATGKKWWEFWK